MTSGRGKWDRLWLVLFRITSDRYTRRWFHTQESAEKYAESVEEAGGKALVRHWMQVTSNRYYH